MNINLHIERLIVDETAYKSEQQPELQRAVIAELHRLLCMETGGPELSSLSSRREIVTEPISLQENSEPAPMGPKIAGAIFGGLQS